MKAKLTLTIDDALRPGGQALCGVAGGLPVSDGGAGLAQLTEATTIGPSIQPSLAVGRFSPAAKDTGVTERWRNGTYETAHRHGRDDGHGPEP